MNSLTKSVKFPQIHFLESRPTSRFYLFFITAYLPHVRAALPATRADISAAGGEGQKGMIKTGREPMGEKRRADDRVTKEGFSYETHHPARIR